METEYNEIHYTAEKHVARITLKRPHKRNALTATLIRELTIAFRLTAQSPSLKVVVLQGEGAAFCAGLDLSELKDISHNGPLDNLLDAEALAELYKLIVLHPKLVISKVQGIAYAGGCGLALSCDISIASETAQFAFTETKIGFIPALVAVILLRRTRNAGVRELLLRANVISAEEAYRLGMLTHVVGEADLESKLEEVVSEIVSKTSLEAISLTKRLIAHAESPGLDDALRYAVALNTLSRSTDDVKRGIEAFLKKEPVNWTSHLP